jgi:3',5'-cyclic AMP phosphodiesterase CpdA
MLIGGSHATHWYPAVNRLARERGWRLLTAVKAGCRLDLSRDFAQTARDVSCKLWLQALVARVKRNPPDIVITTGTITSTTDERLPAGYLDMWRRFNRLGIRVIAIRDTPRAPFKRVDCLRAHRSEPRRCAVARNPTLDRTNPLVRRRDELPRNVLTVDVTDAFCTATTCPAVSGSYVIYRDRHHITETYSRRLASVLGAQIP